MPKAVPPGIRDSAAAVKSAEFRGIQVFLISRGIHSFRRRIVKNHGLGAMRARASYSCTCTVQCPVAIFVHDVQVQWTVQQLCQLSSLLY